MLTRIVLRDNAEGQSLELEVDLDQQGRDWLNKLGEQITHATDWDVTLLAVDPQ
jgi:hypothetical protein